MEVIDNKGLPEELAQHAATIGEKAPSKVGAAETALAEGIEIGRQQAVTQLRQEMDQKVGGIWDAVKRHFSSNKGKYGIVIGALGTVAVEAGYAAYRGKRGDQLSYMRQGEDGVYTAGGEGTTGQGQGQTTGTQGAGQTGRGR